MKGEMDKVGSAKSSIGKIKTGVGKGPAMGAGGEVDPTSKGAPVKEGNMGFMSDSELKPNAPGGNTKSF